jgi:sRNA-binding regulator protein Hfq
MPNTAAMSQGPHKPVPSKAVPEQRTLNLEASAPIAKVADNGASAPAIGPRKLVRPPLTAVAGTRVQRRREPSPMLVHQIALENGPAHTESSHAEAFYFQKQMQMQTPLVFVLEGDERIEGQIEWYDRNAIKVRNHRRVLIYKSSIKYLYKANESQS